MIPAAQATHHDITLPIISELCGWPGEPEVTVDADAELGNGDGVNTSRVHLGSHSGTHVDAPWHVREDGTKLDEIALDRWCGPCYVSEIPHEIRRITPEHLEHAHIPTGTDRLLLKTANSSLWDRPQPWRFEPSYTGLGHDAARWLVERGVRLVGIDYLSIEPYEDEGLPAHHELLGNDVLIIEGLDLRNVEPGRYHLACLPLRLMRGDGAPARAILTALP